MVLVINIRYDADADLEVCPVELLQRHLPGQRHEEYRKMLGQFGVGITCRQEEGDVSSVQIQKFLSL